MSPPKVSLLGKDAQKCEFDELHIHLLLLRLYITIVNVLRRHHRLDWKCLAYKGLPTNVHVDSDNQLIHASHDHDADTDTNSMNILHEYNRHLVAYKDVDSSTCYIDRLDETFEEGYQRWRSYEEGRNSSQALKVISQSIEVEVLQHIGDIHIYAHCQNAQSFWVKEIDIREVTTEMRVVYV
ncbi:unnamed protein product [Candidula unifasciata]|uniref:BRICHOS domain-containing protein n=1 Tax=Candidula unifasciata TaxID=100452 RepID=A0A8S3YDB7_9EUPU|nr:unnamed protein product [Candidula unifasciata]